MNGHEEHTMSLSARHLLRLARALRSGEHPEQHPSWEWMARVLAARLIGEGA